MFAGGTVHGRRGRQFQSRRGRKTSFDRFANGFDERLLRFGKRRGAASRQDKPELPRFRLFQRQVGQPGAVPISMKAEFDTDAEAGGDHFVNGLALDTAGSRHAGQESHR